MTHRVTVILLNKRVREVFNPIYLNTTTRREARDVALDLLRDELVESRQSMEPCHVYASVITMKDGVR